MLIFFHVKSVPFTLEIAAIKLTMLCMPTQLEFVCYTALSLTTEFNSKITSEFHEEKSLEVNLQQRSNAY